MGQRAASGHRPNQIPVAGPGPRTARPSKRADDAATFSNVSNSSTSSGTALQLVRHRVEAA